MGSRLEKTEFYLAPGFLSAFAGADAGADWFLAATGRAGSTQRIMMRIASRVIRTFPGLTSVATDSNLLNAPCGKTSGFYFMAPQCERS